MTKTRSIVALTSYEREHCTHGAQTGFLAIRGLTDENLWQTMFEGTRQHALMCRLLGPNTNPGWVSAEAATEAHARGLISDDALDSFMGSL